MSKKVIIFFIISVFLTTVLFVSNYTSIKAEDYVGIFTGQSGSPTDDTLYNVTNTYNYNGDNASEDELIKRTYNYYNTSVDGKNNEEVMTGAPQITVLTHGLSGAAFHWSNSYRSKIKIKF